MNNIDFSKLIGKSGILCAVDGHSFRVGDLTFEAVEDSMDGYRSSLKHFRVVDNIRPTFRENIRFEEAEGEYTDGIQLVNDIGSVILTVGTSNYDDYYPFFVFEYNPERLTSNFAFEELMSRVTD
jgi:hypothetical protein